MKKIKFRAWSPKTKQMFLPGGQHPFYMDFLGHIYIGSSVADKLILMEYTRLKDKNGKEICDGDILQLSGSFGVNREAEVVELKEYEGDRGKEFGYWWYSYVPEGAEVIGNIYENPELLEKI